MANRVEDVTEDKQESKTLELGMLYPTIGMKNLMEELRKIRTINDPSKIATFRKDFCLYTNITEIKQIIDVVVLFKKHMPLFSNKEEYDTKAKPEVDKYCETRIQESKNIVILYMCLMEHFMRRNYVLLIFNKGGQTFEMIDLQETPETARFVTIEECNYCRKEATTKPLDLCGRCHKAAYCNADCQASDWRSFHKYYCAHLIKPGVQ